MENNGSIIGAAFWMVLISLLLCWLPGLGSLVGGLVGGKKAGGVGKAIVAAFLPSIVISIFMFFISTSLTGIPIIGLIAGAGSFILSVAYIGPLLVGAIIGGLFFN